MCKCEAPLFVLLKICQEISEKGKSISQIISPFKRYFHSSQINLEVKDKQKKLSELEEKYKEGKISHLDGVRVDFKD